ncbi:amino acid/amide ABC transporter membrane protein 1, HAAT family [Rhizobiales bacterium GAS113]|nr:amino acid/amide ABC transporter membrane protein 1, HAAT family [Rhizobiales bacterium GAS113]SEE72309.1 branched-chain amino acid transport system permease protein [Rhizobiales bacterium GAS188]
MDLQLVSLFLQQGIASGLVVGSVYALLALAIVIIFKTSEVPNFAQGEMLMASGYVALYLLVFQALPIWATLPATLIAAFAGAALFRRLVLTQVARASGSPVNLVIATLGLSYVLKGLVRHTGFGDTPRSFPSLVSMDSVMIGQASVTRLDLVILGTALAVMAALFVLFAYTKTGKAMRAVGMNPRAAQLVGVDLNRIHMLVWGLSGLISAIAALLISPKILMTADMGSIVTLGFASAIVGGFASLPGAVIGGFIIGIAENLVGLFVSTRAIVVAPFLAIMLVLILRPQGLLGGRAAIKKV